MTADPIVTDEAVWPAGATAERPARVNGHHHDEPASDVAAERAVLGAALLQPDIVPELAAIIGDQDWHLPAHETIWHAIGDRIATGQPVDPALIAHDIGTHRTLAAHSGPLYLHDLIADPGLTVSNATWHARTVAETARQRRWATLGHWLKQATTSGVDEAAIRVRVEKMLEEKNPADRKAHSSWAAVDLTDALAGIEEEPPTLMPRSDGHCLLYAGAVHTLSGEPGTAKTWIALHAALHELQNGHQVTVIDFEDRPARVVARLLRIGATKAQISLLLRYVRPHLALDTKARPDLQAAVTGSTLCIIDGVTEAMSMHGLKIGDNNDVSDFYGLLPRWVADQDCTVLLIDHVVKDSENQGRWGIGGQHKLAGIDGAAYTVKNVQPFGRGKAGHSRVFIAKDRHGHVEEHALGRCAAEFHLDSTDPDISRATLEAPEAMPTTDGGDMRPTALMEKASRWIEITPDCTGADIDRAKLGKQTYVRKAVQVLIAEGYVSTYSGARNAVHHQSVTPYRRDQDDQEGAPE